MIYYLLDTSALGHIYTRENPRLTELLEYIFLQRIRGRAFLYLPNFCVPEIFNIFARNRYRKRIINDSQYENLRTAFRDHIRNRKTLYSYDLNRYHNINTDIIFTAEHTTAPLRPSRRAGIEASKCSLSALDILIIAMGIELKHVHSGNDVYLVTNDERLSNVCNKIKSAPKAFYLEMTYKKDLPK